MQNTVLNRVKLIRLMQDFSLLDQDKNGSLSKIEIESALNQMLDQT